MFLVRRWLGFWWSAKVLVVLILVSLILWSAEFLNASAALPNWLGRSVNQTIPLGVAVAGTVVAVVGLVVMFSLPAKYSARGDDGEE